MGEAYPNRRGFSGSSILHFTISIACCLLMLPCSARRAFAESGQDAASDSASPSIPDAPAPQHDNADSIAVRKIPVHILKDQAAIWGSPAHIRVADLNWLVPLAGITAGAIVTDHDSIAHVVPVDTQLNHRSVQASNGMLGAIIAVPVVNAAIGAFGDHPRAREAAILSTEAAVDSAVVEQGMKLMFWRERPGVDNANGKFWQRSAGTDSSFPSSHSVFAWSLAAIIAGEYPSRFTKVAIYGLATGVSATRVAGRDHFPADVLVGSAAGWLIGHYIVRKRHHWDDDYDTP